MKKKINKAGILAATKAINKYRECLGINPGEFIDLMGTFFTMGDTLDILKPFDMLANGAIVERISDDVLSEYFDEWLRFIELFEKDNAYDDLQVAFIMMQGMIIRRSHEFSQAAFIGVYGHFRVALAICIVSKIGRLRGILKSMADIQEEIKSQRRNLSNAESMARVADVRSKGEKTREDYLKLQYEVFKESYVDCIDDGETPKITGIKGLLKTIWDMPKLTIAGNSSIDIPKNAGLKEGDWLGKTQLAQNWVRRLERAGLYKRRKNKPGAGGARVRR